MRQGDESSRSYQRQEQNLKHIHYFFGLALVLFARPTFALPEIARYGQFSCTACHVSPAGGGTLTTYGRDFSADKLSTWHYDTEENALEGLVPANDHYLIGGDARWVRYQYKSGDDTLSKFWRMQTDIELGAHYGPVWITGMMGTKPAGPMDDPKDYSNLIHRGYSARVDLFDEHLLIRAGLFTPKYGLMLADHTAYVRTATGLGPNTEQTQVEMIYQSDLFEATVAGLIQSNMYDREGKSKSGYNIGASTFIAGNTRINANILSTKLSVSDVDTLMTSMGVSGAVTFTNRLYGMFEFDRVSNAIKSETFTQGTEAIINFYSLNFEAYKGIIPYLRYEYYDNDINTTDTSNSRWGGGVTWYPRPHLELEGRVLHSIINATKSFTDESDVILHYYF